MAVFRIQEEARKWFAELRSGNGPFRVDFDIYYFCFVAGLAARVKKSVPTSETAELVDNFPAQYKSRGRLMVSLFLTRELRELGIEMSQREAVNSAIARLIDPHARNFLSDEGVREFNNYANGGYSCLLDWFDDKPRNLETFLRAFDRYVDEKLPS